MTLLPPPSQAYRDAYEGRLSGLLMWEDYDQVMAAVSAAPEGWYLYDTRAALPDAPVPVSELPAQLAAITAFLRDRQRANYCGFVYVDERTSPAMIKVYDPRNASACGTSAASIPVFTLSRTPPETLPFAEAAPPRTGVIGRLFKGSK